MPSASHCQTSTAAFEIGEHDICSCMNLRDGSPRLNDQEALPPNRKRERRDHQNE